MLWLLVAKFCLIVQVSHMENEFSWGTSIEVYYSFKSCFLGFEINKFLVYLFAFQMTSSTNLVDLCVGFAPVHSHTRPQDRNTLASAKIIKFFYFPRKYLFLQHQWVGPPCSPREAIHQLIADLSRRLPVALVALFLFVGKTVPTSTVWTEELMFSLSTNTMLW